MTQGLQRRSIIQAIFIQHVLTMHAKLLTTLVLGALALVGCASGGADYQPIVDTKGLNQAKYQTDLAECRALSEQAQSAGTAAAKDAAAGAALGAVVGAIGGNRRDASQTAGMGAVFGGVAGAGSAVKEKNTVLRNCLRGRGYHVLN